MDLLTSQRYNILNDGFTIIEAIYNPKEIELIVKLINQSDQSNDAFRKTTGLFAIRQFVKEIPGVIPVVFNQRLRMIINDLFGDDYFVVKSIYFDKPENSNWFVGWHQDLTISVNKKIEMPGYSSWTIKMNQFAVQPPVEILQDNFTIRVHLDNTDERNGALKVIPGSHSKGISRSENIDWENEKEFICSVKRGSIMIMRPLLMHASDRTASDKKRRVIHIEFSKSNLSVGIDWAEKQAL